MKSHNGQVSLEAITAAILVLGILVLVIVQLNNWRETVDVQSGFSAQKNECARLQSSVSLVSTSEQNAQVEFVIHKDANVSGRYARFTDFTCDLGTNSGIANIVIGNVRVKKISGVVIIENF